MDITEEIIDDLTEEIEDLLESSENTDELWKNIIVPLMFESLKFFENDLTPDDKQIIASLKILYERRVVDLAHLKELNERIWKIKKNGSYSIRCRLLLSTMMSLAYFPIGREDWDNGPLWLRVSGLLEAGIPLQWMYHKLTNIKSLLQN